ncbi:hypothetical protein [Maridesulfovibrio ferrireducens]|uniref:hypothetical protein n=1 Tax=Maridesulfovibrio ferrireducens TaxID=246191 RepID=UPI001A1F3D13|nr:hypothetical protein [Maridesulfovibrio ferrireducens]MBI9112254.1 hypothetical protein [Maridesulfovibrio ferrireducens]
MKTVVMLLSLLTILSACNQKRVSKIDEVRRVEVVAKYVECVSPEKPNFQPLLEDQHIGSKENVSRTMHNAVESQAYTEGLEAENNCYRSQAGK